MAGLLKQVGRTLRVRSSRICKPGRSRFSVVREPAATSAAVKYLWEDPAGLHGVYEAVDRLADDPRPPEAVPWTADTARLRVGRYRVPYRIADERIAVVVLHLGRSDRN